ncbi:putative ribosomal N-acetyltransferase ydaF [Microbacterium sp. HM58-2]|nr:putative ribosomal N-acetyltransferase ydaF [Microbacterium sp. HM58-2]
MPAFVPVVIEATADLTLSPFTIDDAPALTEAVDDTQLRRWLPLPDPYTISIAESWCIGTTRELRDNGQGLVLALRHRGQFAGCIDAKRVDWRARTAELGYWTASACRGRGLMPQAVSAFSSWLIADLGFQRLELRIAPGNLSSIRVAEKAGFTYEGIARNAGYTDVGRVDLAIFSRIASDLGLG